MADFAFAVGYHRIQGQGKITNERVIMKKACLIMAFAALIAGCKSDKGSTGTDTSTVSGSSTTATTPSSTTTTPSSSTTTTPSSSSTSTSGSIQTPAGGVSGSGSIQTTP